MDSREDDESFSRLPFDDRGIAIGKLRNRRAPPGKLGTVLPEHIQWRRIRKGDFDRLLMNAFVLVGVEVERYAGCEVHPVVPGICTEESARTNSQVMNAVVFYRPADVRRGLCRETLAYHDRVPPGYDDQLVSSELGFAHRIQLR